MEKLIYYFTPAPEQVLAFGALLVVCAGLFLLGGLIRGQHTLPEINLIAGWGVVSLVMIAGGSLLRIDLRLIAATLGTVAILSCIRMHRQRGTTDYTDLARTLLLALPLLWLTSTMTISQWDEFTHWMPNAWYLVEHNALPGLGNPEPTSNLPGYPHTLAFVTYLTSAITGRLAEVASAVFTVILLTHFAVTLGRVAKDTVRGVQSDGRIGWIYCAIGALAVTGFNPTFVPKIVFTAYADTPTMVLVGMLCVLMWMLLNTLSGSDDRYSAKTLAWGFGMVAMAAAGTKQPNIVLCGLLAIGGLVVALRDAQISVRAYLKLLPAILLPAFTIYLAWRLHLHTNQITGEFQFLGPDGWMLDKIHIIAGQMLTVATKKGGYFSVMLIACIFGARALWRIRTPFDRLSLIVAILFAGYVSFLLFVYVTAFGPNGLVAPSFWRFNMHLGGACVAFGVYIAAMGWRRYISGRLRVNLSWAVIAVILCAPFAIAYKIRFDLHPPALFVRSVAEDVATIVPKKAMFSVLDVTGNGEFEVVMRYVVTPHLTYRGFVTVQHVPTVANLRKFVRQMAPQYMWIHVPTKEVEEAFDVALKRRHAHLVRMDGLRATLMKSWPYPGYDDPNNVPD